MKRIASVLVAVLVLSVGCITTGKVDYSNYRLNDETYEKFSQEKSVYIAPIELLSVRIGNFRETYEVVQTEIESYIENNGFNVLSSEKCEGTFIHNASKVGGFFNQKTGRMDSKLLQECINGTIEELKMGGDFSAIVLPFLVFSNLGLEKPYTWGTWDGVKRKVETNSSSGMSFSPVKTMSLKVIVLSSDGDLIFESTGGIDFIQKVKEMGSISDRGVGLVTKDSDDFSLEDIREGIEIAFHPFVSCQRIGDVKQRL